MLLVFSNYYILSLKQLNNVVEKNVKDWQKILSVWHENIFF